MSLNVTVVALEMSQHNSLDNIDFTTGERINCPGLIERKFSIDILYVIVIMLMMLVLLRYIAQFVHFLYTFVLIIQNVETFHTFSLTILVSQKYCNPWACHLLVIINNELIWSLYIWGILPRTGQLWLFVYSFGFTAYE